MMKTIKQVADELGVSKTAVRNYMDDGFREKYTEKDDKGVITITPEGCKVLSEIIGKPPENTANNNAESEFVTIPQAVWELIEAQLREKDEQLKAKDQQIADLTKAVKSQAESINADRHTNLAEQLQLQNGGSDEPKKKGWQWPWNKK